MDMRVALIKDLGSHFGVESDSVVIILPIPWPGNKAGYWDDFHHAFVQEVLDDFDWHDHEFDIPPIKGGYTNYNGDAALQWNEHFLALGCSKRSTKPQRLLNIYAKYEF